MTAEQKDDALTRLRWIADLTRAGHGEPTIDQLREHVRELAAIVSDILDPPPIEVMTECGKAFRIRWDNESKCLRECTTGEVVRIICPPKEPAP